MAILPQDKMKLWDVIPPHRDEVREVLCALFISSGCTAMVQNVEHLRPILVNKGIVCTLANFLITHNPWYHGQVTVDEQNIEYLYKGMRKRVLPSTIEIACLNSQMSLIDVDQY